MGRETTTLTCSLTSCTFCDKRAHMTLCQAPRAQAASFSHHYIDLQVNTALYLLRSPWTHLKTCGSLPRLNAFLPFPPLAPPPTSSRSLPRAQSTPLGPDAINSHQAPLCLSRPVPANQGFFLNSLFKMFHNPALQKDNTEIFMRNTAVCCHHYIMIFLLMRAERKSVGESKRLH